MRVLIISKYGDGAGLAWKMKQEGQQVTLYIKEAYARRVMEGLVPKTNDLKDALKNKPDFVLMDMSGMGDLAEDLQKQGLKVIGGSKLMDKLELDRSYGVSIAKQFGIAVPPSNEFSSIDKAIEFVRQNPKAWAIKLDNNQGTSSSYVSKDAKDMIDYLSFCKEEGTTGEFLLQEKIDGAEISTELWCSNGVPIWGAANSTVEDKKLLSGGLGPRTGCETSLVFHYENPDSKILNQTVRPLLPFLKYTKWTGCIDVNTIVSEKDKKAYFLEFTPRLGYSAIYGFMAMLKMPISEFFYRMAQGKDFEVTYRAKWGSSLKLHIPPYPFDDEDFAEDVYAKTEGVRINGKPNDDFIPVDVMKGKRTPYEAAGTSGIIGECLGRGSTLLEAWKGSQAVFKDVEAPNKGGRLTDGAEDGWKRILKLRNWGFSEIPNPSGTSLGSGGRVYSTPLVPETRPH